jgi:hypothetical protein
MELPQTSSTISTCRYMYLENQKARTEEVTSVAERLARVGPFQLGASTTSAREPFRQKGAPLKGMQALIKTTVGGRRHASHGFRGFRGFARSFQLELNDREQAYRASSLFPPITLYVQSAPRSCPCSKPRARPGASLPPGRQLPVTERPSCLEAIKIDKKTELPFAYATAIQPSRDLDK